MTVCDRCGDDTHITIMSRFNEDSLCMACKKQEEQHPDYQEAVRIEAEEVKKGNRKFPGIGKPADL